MEELYTLLNMNGENLVSSELIDHHLCSESSGIIGTICSGCKQLFNLFIC